jgi:hypothetical protein
VDLDLPELVRRQTGFELRPLYSVALAPPIAPHPAISPTAKAKALNSKRRLKYLFMMVSPQRLSISLAEFFGCSAER